MCRVTIKVKEFFGKECTKFIGMEKEQWESTQRFCFVCGKKTIVRRFGADSKWACLACNCTFYISKIKNGEQLSNKDRQRLNTLRYRWNDLGFDEL